MERPSLIKKAVSHFEDLFIVQAFKIRAENKRLLNLWLQYLSKPLTLDDLSDLFKEELAYAIYRKNINSDVTARNPDDINKLYQNEYEHRVELLNEAQSLDNPEGLISAMVWVSLRKEGNLATIRSLKSDKILDLTRRSDHRQLETQTKIFEDALELIRHHADQTLHLAK